MGSSYNQPVIFSSFTKQEQLVETVPKSVQITGLQSSTGVPNRLCATERGSGSGKFGGWGDFLLLGQLTNDMRTTTGGQGPLVEHVPNSKRYLLLAVKVQCANNLTMYGNALDTCEQETICHSALRSMPLPTGGISRARSLTSSAYRPKIATSKLLNQRGLVPSNLQSSQIGFTPSAQEEVARVSGHT